MEKRRGCVRCHGLPQRSEPKRLSKRLGIWRVTNMQDHVHFSKEASVFNRSSWSGLTCYACTSHIDHSDMEWSRRALVLDFQLTYCKRQRSTRACDCFGFLDIFNLRFRIWKKIVKRLSKLTIYIYTDCCTVHYILYSCHCILLMLIVIVVRNKNQRFKELG